MTVQTRAQEAIEKARLRGWTYDSLARETGLSARTLKRWGKGENPRNEVTLSHLEQIVALLPPRRRPYKKKEKK